MGGRTTLLVRSSPASAEESPVAASIGASAAGQWRVIVHMLWQTCGWQKRNYYKPQTQRDSY